MVLFPKIKNAENSTIIVTSGTSCRHQIEDGVAKKTYHQIFASKRVIIVPVIKRLKPYLMIILFNLLDWLNK